jgi:transposase
MKYFIMSQKEVDTYQVIKRSLESELTVQDAANLTGFSERHIYRLRLSVRTKGSHALVHGNRGRESNNKIPEEEKERIVEIIREKYPDFWPSHAKEKLENHGLCYSSEVIRQIMIKNDLWKPKKRKTNEYRAKRPPKEHFGEMAILDGSYHNWFEGRDKTEEKCCLILFLDDATSIPLFGMFVKNENLKDLYLCSKGYFLHLGKPKTIYSDGLRVYHNNLMEKESEERLTQFKKSMKELDIEMIRAYSAEAKGKIEVIFRTLQNRLVKEMRLRGISDKETANRYLFEEFFPWYSKRYGNAPVKKGNFHRKISKKEKNLLPSILSERHTRVVHNDFCIHYKTRLFQLLKDQPATVRKKERVVIEERMDSSIWIRLREKYLNYKEITTKERETISEKDIPWIIPATQKKKTPWKPAPDHPWRKPFILNPEKRRQTALRE